MHVLFGILDIHNFLEHASNYSKNLRYVLKMGPGHIYHMIFRKPLVGWLVASFYKNRSDYSQSCFKIKLPECAIYHFVPDNFVNSFSTKELWPFHCFMPFLCPLHSSTFCV